MPDRIFGESVRGRQRLQAEAAVIIARLTRFFLRRLGRGATALPGNLGLRIKPDLLKLLVHNRQVFLVTGTNGKTTTVRMLCTLLEDQGYEIITNPSGANLDSGLTTTLIGDIRKLKRKKDNDKLALVFEIDEAYFARLAADLNPSYCIVTNFFRDQLDRFGELQHTRDLIAKGIAATKAQIILCADDSLCASLGKELPNRTLYFGMRETSMTLADVQLNSTANSEKTGGRAGDGVGKESAFCIFCGTRYNYKATAYGHLGIFQCPGCGYLRPEPDLTFEIVSAMPQQLDASFFWQTEAYQASLTIPGVHNAYNAAAAMAAALAAGLSAKQAAASLTDVKAAFGRMERFSIGDKDVCLILVKNPVGMDRALEFVSQAPDRAAMMFLLNANDPDGRDVSWIWDADFESLLPKTLTGVSGVRRHDMALRLYYAGLAKEQIRTEDDALALFDQMLAACEPGQCLYVLPNYTAMLDLRARLAARYQLKAFWE